MQKKKKKKQQKLKIENFDKVVLLRLVLRVWECGTFAFFTCRDLGYLKYHFMDMGYLNSVQFGNITDI